MAVVDVIPPPTGVIDVLYLGPAGILVGLGLIAGAVAAFIRLRRAGRGRLLSAALAMLVFVAGNLLAYAVYVQFLWRSPSRDRRLPPPALSASSPSSSG